MTRTDRTWPVPARAWTMRMHWHDVLFMHWPIAMAAVAKHLPDGLTLDTFDGQAWIGVVPFRMSDVAPRGMPAFPWLSAFPELNVRTYVTAGDKPGVWFFSLDAASPIAVRVARFFFHLKYMDARMSIVLDDGWYDYSSCRTHRNEPVAELNVKYRPLGEPFCAPAGALEHWLTSRYCLYTANRRGQLLRGEIDHPSWPLRLAEAEVTKNTMLDSLGLELLAKSPHLLFAKEIAVQAWTTERV